MLEESFSFHNFFYCISLSRCDCFTSSGASRENCTVCRIYTVDHPLPRFNKKERLITQVLSTQVILCSPRIQPCGDQFAVIEQIVTLFTSHLFANWPGLLHTPSKQDRCSKREEAGDHLLLPPQPTMTSHMLFLHKVFITLFELFHFCNNLVLSE